MSMAEIMRKVADLPRKQQNELAAFLLHLRLRQDPAWRKEMARRIDDRDENNWVPLQQAKRLLGRKARSK